MSEILTKKNPNFLNNVKISEENSRLTYVVIFDEKIKINYINISEKYNGLMYVIIFDEKMKTLE